MLILAVLIIFSTCVDAVVRDLSSDQVNGIFLEALVEKYGTNHRLSKEQFGELVKRLAARHEEKGLSQLNISELVFRDNDLVCNSTQLDSCTENLTKHCLDYESIFDIFSTGDYLNAENLTQVFPSLVFYLQNHECDDYLFWKDLHHHLNKKPSTAESWGYALGFVIFINIISNVGACLGPFMKTNIFQEMLMFCVALAVGTLAGTGFLVLIPESMGLTDENSPVPDYVWKLSTVIGGIYIFYLAEQVMTSLTTNSEKKEGAAFPLRQKEKDIDELGLDGHGHSYGGHGQKVDPVAWMVLCGDSLHNFVDGLAIGAAFTENILTGLSVSLAVVCEELPHELGDIAILLHSGLSMKKALLYNFLAALVCFAGLIVGIVVGENTNANRWIFAVAGGMFVYISLVDMIPQMAAQAKKFTVNGDNTIKVNIIQNFGLIIGFLIIMLIAHFGGDITI